jgi:formylglycine-generating enzyme required for sulfatase activity
VPIRPIVAVVTLAVVIPAVTTFCPAQCQTPLTAAQERGLKPKDSFRECENCPEMVVVPPGSFTMGSPGGEKDRFDWEGPQHDVTIGKAFAAGKLHVTVGQFGVFVRETGYEASPKCRAFAGGKWETSVSRSWRNPGFVQEPSHPAVCVTWDDAAAYVDWIAKKTGKPYRLPSEAEWEYAARGRTQPGAYPQFWFGDDDKASCRSGNGADQTIRDIPGWGSGRPTVPCDDGYGYTSPAGHYAPNAFGLYDMAGNAWQWTADCWHENYDGAPADGSAWTTACRRGHMHRGGSWASGPRDLRAAARFGLIDEVDNVGFRVARTLIQQGP